MPYDVDNTFGIDWFNIDWAKRDPYAWSPSNEARPLYTKILEIPAYRKEYTRLFRDFLAYISTNDYLINRVRATRDLIAPHVLSDPLHSADYGWSYNDFITSFNARLNTGHVKYGVIPYITTRIEQAYKQLDAASGTGEFIVQLSPKVYPIPSTGYLNIENGQEYQSFRIINSVGCTVKSGQMENNPHQGICLDDLPEGIYFLQLNAPGTSPYTTKFLLSGTK
jgi:hypothetical protein